MIFGTTYCNVSHLPINDGDKCILIPLGFSLGGDFNKWNKPDINDFINLYYFVGEPQEVIYNGNPSDITPLNPDYQKSLDYELYVLIHYDFYNEVISSSLLYHTIDNMPLDKSTRKLRELVHDNYDREKLPIQKKFKDGEFDDKEFLKKITEIEIPRWINDLFKFYNFIKYLGIGLNPCFSVDQHNSIREYERIRDKIRNKKDDL